MKFILLLEEQGYEVRYWDQITEQIGESIATNWNKKKLYELLLASGFNIKKDDLKEAFSILDSGEKPFVVLASLSKGPIDLDTFIHDQFVIDKETQDGK
jgi:hypothetical protein